MTSPAPPVPVPATTAPVPRESVVIVQPVPPEAHERFRLWQQGIINACEQFPGYISTDQYPPEPGSVDPWVIVLHFVDRESARRWIESPMRAEWIARLERSAQAHETTFVHGGLGAWFARRAGRAATPPGWKMVLTVLLGLYPTVMFLTWVVGPWTNGLGLAVAMLIGNALSVSLLQWLVMPVLNRVVSPWLTAEPQLNQRNIVGTVLVLATLAAMTCSFVLINRLIESRRVTKAVAPPVATTEHGAR